MKSYDETIASVFAKGDAIIAEKKRRMAMIRRFSLSASGICAVLIVSIGIWKNSALNTPLEKNAGKEQLGVIAETTDTQTPLTTAALHGTTSVNTTKTTSYTASASTAADISSGTTSIVTTAEAVISDAEIQTATQTSLTTVTQTSTVSASDTVTETQTTAETNEITTVHTTATASIQESAEEIAYVRTTTADIMPVTTHSTTNPTAVTEIPESFPVLTSIIYNSLDFEGVETTYSSVLLENVPIIKGNYLGSGIIHGTDATTNKNIDIQASIWTVHDISTRFALAANGIREGKYTVFLNENYSCQTFGELLDNIDAPNELELGQTFYQLDGKTEYSKAVPRYIFDLLSELADAPKVYSMERVSEKSIIISADMPVLDWYGLVIEITENGYIAMHFPSSDMYFLTNTKEFYELIDMMN